jgi:hypothetical protein
MTFPFPSFNPAAAVTDYALFINSYSDVSNLSTYTFNSVPLGAPSTYRKIIVAVSAGSSSGQVTSMTVAGVAAECITQNTASNVIAEIWQAWVPSGSSGSIVVNISGSPSRCAIAVYKIATEMYVCDNDFQSSGASLTATDILVKNGGRLFGCGHVTSAADQTFTYNGVDSFNEDLDLQLEALSSASSGSAIITESPGRVRDLTYSGVGTGRKFVAASLEPARSYAICEYLDNRLSVSSLTTYSHDKIPIGKPAAGRLIIAAISWNTTTSAKTLSSCTIGGVAATIHAQNGTVLVGVAIVSAIVPTGEVADISYTMSAGVLGSGVALLRAEPASATPVDAVSNQTTAATSIPVTDVAISAGGFAVAVELATGTSTLTFNGTDTLVVDFSVDTDGYGFSVAHVLTTESNTTRDFTAANTDNNDIAAAAVSWL